MCEVFVRIAIMRDTLQLPLNAKNIVYILMSLGQRCHLTLSFFNPNFFGHKIFRSKNFWSPHYFGLLFLGLNIFWPLHFYINFFNFIFLVRNFLDQTFFGPKIFGSNIFGLKNILNPNILLKFLDRKFV